MTYYKRTSTPVPSTLRKRKQRDNMVRLTEELKSPCLFCGTDSNIVWHHFNPLDKVCNVVGAGSYKLMYQEIDKCWCLCEDCHTKLHQRLVDPLPICYGVDS